MLCSVSNSTTAVLTAVTAIAGGKLLCSLVSTLSSPKVEATTDKMTNKSFGYYMLQPFEESLSLSSKQAHRIKVDNDDAFYELTILKLSGDDKESKLKVLQRSNTHPSATESWIQSLQSFTKSGAKDVYLRLTKWKSVKDYRDSKRSSLATRERTTLPERIHPGHDNDAIYPDVEILYSCKMRPVDGKTWDLQDIIQSGMGIEFGIRSLKNVQNFANRRERFISRIVQNTGFAWDREYVVVNVEEERERLHIDDDGEQDNLSIHQPTTLVIVFGWESWKAFEQAQWTTLSSPRTMMELIRYFLAQKMEAFQAGVLVHSKRE